MPKIETLTSEQEAAIPHFIDKWLNMPTREFTEEETRKVVERMYSSMGKIKPIVLFFDSPLSCEIVGNFLYSQLDSQLGSQLDSQLDSQLGSQLRSQLGSQLYSQLGSQLYSQLGSQLYSQLDSQLGSQLDSQLDSQLGSQLRSQLYSQLGSQLYSQLGSQLYSQLGSQLYSQLDSQLRSQLRSQLYSQLGSQQLSKLGYCNIWWTVWSGFYDFGQYIGVKFNEEAFSLFNDYNGQVVYAVAFEGFCIVSRKPKFIQWKDQRLHAEGFQAVEFRDGWGWYAYEGVRIPEKYGAVPVSQWKPEWIDEERNVDIRAKLLKGIGFERWMEASGGKTVNEQEIFGLPYKLIFKEDRDIGTMKFLHMKNPSVPGVYHLEPVAPHSWIKTCEDALRWRQIGDLAKDKTIKIQYQFIK